MTNAVVKTFLLLNESDGSGSVAITLNKGNAINGTNNPVVYEGEMTYNGQSIDVIDAVFSAGSNIDEVSAEITLGGGNSYTGLATDQASGGSGFTNVNQELKNNNTTLSLTFVEPAIGETSGYTKMYFHTEQGVIDPAVEVERQPR